MSTATDTKPTNSNLIYLFALLATGAATGLQFAVPSIIAYAAVVAIGAIIGMIISRAGLGKATLAFLLSAAAAALVYYFVVAGMLQHAADAASSGESAEVRAAASRAGADAGSTIGAFVAIVAFVQTFLPGFLGAAIGALVRPKQRVAQVRQPAMAA